MEDGSEEGRRERKVRRRRTAWEKKEKWRTKRGDRCSGTQRRRRLVSHLQHSIDDDHFSRRLPRVNHDNTKQSIIQRLDENALNNDIIRPSSLRSVEDFLVVRRGRKHDDESPSTFHQAADPFRLKCITLKRNPSHHPHSNAPTRQWERLPRLLCGRSRRSCSTRPDAELTDLSDDV